MGAEPVLGSSSRASRLTFGQPLQRYPFLASTQIRARELAEQGAPEGTTVVAGEQTAGRGRLGSSFLSPPGGLYLSIVLRPSLPSAEIPLIGLAAGAAVSETIEDQSGLRPVLKWPNDVLVGGRKVSGLLVELIPPGIAILGLGVNVNAAPPDLQATAASLAAEAGRELALEPFMTALLFRLEARYGRLLADPASAISGWCDRPNMLGQKVRIATAADVFEGNAEGLDRDGALLVRLPVGDLRRVVAAEVHLLPR
ncbi:MAG TPA: biotin--[acetyl-CoA-carboxylase] ligase [Chloroflexota bacterium]